MITHSLLTTRTQKTRSEWILLSGLAVGLLCGMVWGPILGIISGLGFSILIAFYTLLSLGIKEDQTLPREAILYAQADKEQCWEAFMSSMEHHAGNGMVSLQHHLYRATFETQYAAVEVLIHSNGAGESKILVRAASEENRIRQFIYGSPLFLRVEGQLSQAVIQLNSQNHPSQRKSL